MPALIKQRLWYNVGFLLLCEGLKTYNLISQWIRKNSIYIVKDINRLCI